MNTTTIKERPILMSGPMVRAIRAGTKTQTRRIAKDVKHPDLGNLYAPSVLAREPQHVIDRACPYGQPGDRLWVRETFGYCNDEPMFGAFYRAEELANKDYAEENGVPRWRPSIHMPRWASRLTLEIVSVDIERLHSITLRDICCEGLAESVYDFKPATEGLKAWEDLWTSINGKDSWAANPWVWVVEFKRVK